MGRDATCLDGLTAAGQVRGHLPGIQKGYLNEKKQCKEYPYQRGSAARAGGDDPGGDQGSPDQPVDSVVSVEVAPDLKSCKAWISVLGDEEVRKSTLEGLRSAVGFMRNKLAREINLRNTPEITFIMDQSIEYGVNMSRRIDEVIAQDDENAKDREEDADGEEPEEDLEL